MTYSNEREAGAIATDSKYGRCGPPVSRRQRAGQRHRIASRDQQPHVCGGQRPATRRHGGGAPVGGRKSTGGLGLRTRRRGPPTRDFLELKSVTLPIAVQPGKEKATGQPPGPKQQEVSRPKCARRTPSSNSIDRESVKRVEVDAPWPIAWGQVGSGRDTIAQQRRLQPRGSELRRHRRPRRSKTRQSATHTGRVSVRTGEVSGLPRGHR